MSSLLLSTHSPPPPALIELNCSTLGQVSPLHSPTPLPSLSRTAAHLGGSLPPHSLTSPPLSSCSHYNTLQISGQRILNSRTSETARQGPWAHSVCGKCHVRDAAASLTPLHMSHANTHRQQHAATPSERSTHTQTRRHSWGTCCSISSTPSSRGTTAALTQAHANKEILAESRMLVLISGSGIVGCWRRRSRTLFQM